MNNDAQITVALQTIGVLSSIIFLINYTFEVLVIQGLYSAQYVLVALLHGVLSLWAVIEIALARRQKTSIPLKNLTIALAAQLATGVIRHSNDFVMMLFPASDGIIDDAIAARFPELFFPIYLVLFLVISKLLINAFSHTERLRANQLQEQIALAKRTDEALRNSEERYRQIADRVDDLIWTLAPSGHITYVSPSIQKLLGFSAEDVMARPMTLYVAPTSISVLENIIDAKQAATHYRGELELFRADKSTVWTESNISALCDAHDSFIGFVGVTRDITDRRRQEQALMAAQRAAESANKAKTEFLNNISHEIRTPMNAIIGLSEITLETPLSPQQKHHLKTIQTSAKTLLRMINDILDLAKVEAGHLTMSPDWFEPRKLIADVVDLFQVPINAKGLRFEWEIAEDVPQHAKADDLRLRQVLINLLGNALKFTDQGSIGLALWTSDIASASKLSFSIHDTGIGMTPEQVSQLFQPFIQADASISRRYGGTGLGLSISSRLVELMGGVMTVESHVNEGSTFIFSIPIEHRADANIELCPAAAPLPDDTEPAGKPTSPMPIDPQSLRSSSMYLESLLHDNMFEAQQVAVDLAYRLEGCPLAETFLPVLEAVQHLRYHDAIRLLVSFRNQLSNPKDSSHV